MEQELRKGRIVIDSEDDVPKPAVSEEMIDEAVKLLNESNDPKDRPEEQEPPNHESKP